jgi:hypothetical protein
VPGVVDPDARRFDAGRDHGIAGASDRAAEYVEPRTHVADAARSERARGARRVIALHLAAKVRGLAARIEYRIRFSPI